MANTGLRAGQLVYFFIMLFSIVKNIFRDSDPSHILSSDHTHFYLDTGISHDYPNKWTIVHACLDDAADGNFSSIELLKGKKIMSYSSYLEELSGNKWNHRDLGGCEITSTGIEAIVKVLDRLALDATKLMENISERDLLKLYNIYRKAYFIIFAKGLTIQLPRKARPSVF